MNKYAAWHWDGSGPELARFGFKQVNQVNESVDLSIDAHAVRVAEFAEGLESGEHLVINCERYGNRNVIHAIRLAHAARAANPGVFIGVYVPQVNGDKWGICGRLPSPRDNMIAVQRTTEAIEQLAPWVDFWPVDMHFGESGTNTPVAFWDTTPQATQELIVTQRVAMLEPYGKPWWGVMSVSAVPDLAKPIGTIVNKDWLYAQAAWCRNKGADAVYVMVWDDARHKAEGTGRIANTPNITQTLASIGKL
ncbi:MAG TPA: hypothetical protein VEB22_05600 [Phycisphaerales bacterium]|nr:hypothetical protein [Phycisphaerales bacterium]